MNIWNLFKHEDKERTEKNKKALEKVNANDEKFTNDMDNLKKETQKVRRASKKALSESKKTNERINDVAVQMSVIIKGMSV